MRLQIGHFSKNCSQYFTVFKDTAQIIHDKTSQCRFNFSDFIMDGTPFFEEE